MTGRGRIENTRQSATTGVYSGLRSLRVYPRLFCLVSPQAKSNSVEVCSTVGVCLEASDNERNEKWLPLRKELASIYFADVRYWRQGTKASREATRGIPAQAKIACDKIRHEFRDLLNTEGAIWYAGHSLFPASTQRTSFLKGMTSSVALSIPRWSDKRKIWWRVG